MAQVTSPIILDSTGQQIHSDLQQIKNVLTTPSAAADITFDNTGTGMQADDVQDAITELKSNLTDLLAKFGTVTEDTVTVSTGGSGIININIPKNSIMLAVCPSPDSERCVTQRGFNPNYSATQVRYTYNVYTIYNSGSHYFLDKVFNTSVTFKYYYVTITV